MIKVIHYDWVIRDLLFSGKSRPLGVDPLLHL